MKYETILWTTTGWITIVVLFPLPDWLTAVLVILGTVVVAFVAYGIGRDRRMFTKGSEKMNGAVDTLAQELADTLTHHPELLNDVPREDQLEQAMHEALGDLPMTGTMRDILPTNEPEASVAETPKTPRKRTLRQLTPTSDEVAQTNDETASY